MEIKDNDLKKIKIMCNNMRKNILDMAFEAGSESSHFGGGLSIVEICAVLYGYIMNYNNKNHTSVDRDKFILSKGHGVLGYYAALAEIGLVTKKELKQFEKSEGFLFGHPIMNLSKGIELSTGSLGMGLSVGVGIALGIKKKSNNNKVYVLMGDGECNEGSVWEALMSAPNYKLDNLFVCIDRNNLQQTGSNKEIMDLGDIGKKIENFGWKVNYCDGHSIVDLIKSFNDIQKGKPTAIIANTIKGKGFSFAENNNDWHHKILTKNQYEIALEEINKNGA